MSPPPSDSPGEWVENHLRDKSWTCQPAPSDVQEFHRGMPGYLPTAMIDLPRLADQFGVARIFAKSESNRFGLPSFKALGASFAIHRALMGRDGKVTLVAATDGNHGRAVAHFARQLGHLADIFVPEGVHPTAVEAIRSEGANVEVLPGSYDEVVEAAAAHTLETVESEPRVLVQDTAWDGYQEIPKWIVDGYSTLFVEIDEDLRGQGTAGPDLVIVPTGVGSLLQAAVTHYRGDRSDSEPLIVSVEPLAAACAMAGVSTGAPTTIETGHTVMAGLNCGTISQMAWPYLANGLDACAAVSDDQTLAAVETLSGLGVDAGPCGAASLAALAVLERQQGRPGLAPDATVVLLITEGRLANPW